jgi:hypothetical protein
VQLLSISECGYNGVEVKMLSGLEHAIAVVG